jgi:hypothetical protein
MGTHWEHQKIPKCTNLLTSFKEKQLGLLTAFCLIKGRLEAARNLCS